MERTPRMMGPFQGAIPRTTPAGWRTAKGHFVGRNDLTGDMGGHRSCLAQHVCGEAHIVLRPPRGGARLGRHRRHEVFELRLQNIGRTHQLGPALARTQCRPGWKSGGCRRCRGLSIGNGRGRGAGCELSAKWAVPFEHPGVRGVRIPIVYQKLYVEHVFLLHSVWRCRSNGGTRSSPFGVTKAQRRRCRSCRWRLAELLPFGEICAVHDDAIS